MPCGNRVAGKSCGRVLVAGFSVEGIGFAEFAGFSGFRVCGSALIYHQQDKFPLPLGRGNLSL
jgi:hypothetical protein